MSLELSKYYERAETYCQAEVNSVVSGAIDSLNITQYRTESQVSSSISDALVPYYTASEVDAAIASNSFNAADYFTRTQSDSRCFPNNVNPGNAEVLPEGGEIQGVHGAAGVRLVQDTSAGTLLSSPGL